MPHTHRSLTEFSRLEDSAHVSDSETQVDGAATISNVPQWKAGFWGIFMPTITCFVQKLNMYSCSHFISQNQLRGTPTHRSQEVWSYQVPGRRRASHTGSNRRSLGWNVKEESRGTIRFLSLFLQNRNRCRSHRILSLCYWMKVLSFQDPIAAVDHLGRNQHVENGVADNLNISWPKTYKWVK